MKIFYLTRLFSGLEDSFSSRKWSPSGVPTIYKLIEKIDKDHNVCFYFTAKDSGKGYFSSWIKKNDLQISIYGLKHKVNIITGINFFPIWLGRRLRIYLREIRQIIFVLYQIYKFKPDLLYCDNANILIGAIFARIQKKIPVVFRLMGINESMRLTLSGSKFYDQINRWAYKSKFSLVICTQDGSGVEKWIDLAVSKQTDVKILLNGTASITENKNIHPKLKKLPSDKIVIMFVGKLEKNKGCFEFVQAILLLLKNNIKNVHALIIGNGTEATNILKIVRKAKALSFFSFIRALPHNQIYNSHTFCDIYVSMNHYGNLSNANLEAIQADDCMIIPEPQKEKGIDEITFLLLGNSVIYAPINQPTILSSKLLKLIKTKEKRLVMSKKISEIKKSIIWTWDERIKNEIKILEHINKFGK